MIFGQIKLKAIYRTSINLRILISLRRPHTGLSLFCCFSGNSYAGRGGRGAGSDRIRRIRGARERAGHRRGCRAFGKTPKGMPGFWENLAPKGRERAPAKGKRLDRREKGSLARQSPFPDQRPPPFRAPGTPDRASRPQTGGGQAIDTL